MTRRILQASTTLLGLMLLAGCDPIFPLPGGETETTNVVLRWNQIAIDTSGLDHKAVEAGESRTFGHQLGPTRAARAMAIVHIAMFDSLNAIRGGYQSYTGTAPFPLASVRVAVAKAAHKTLVALYPSHAPRLDALLQEDLDAVIDPVSKQRGLDLGTFTADRILAMRDGDGSEISDAYVFSDAPGKWRVDPINPTQKPHGANWYRVKPFALNSATQFRCPAPPEMDSQEYTDAYNEVKELGGDGIVTPTTRTEEQGRIGIYWAYDGTPSLCAPPRLYNQIARQIASDQNVKGIRLARLLTVLNIAMADAGIAAWESKYYYNVWRPVTGIRESDPGTGPSLLGDGNASTTGDPTYVPLCAPASNLTAANFTPPFPSYPSGHAVFGGALFETMRNFLGTDNVGFTFTSDEFNGTTKDNQGNVRPLWPRTFAKLSDAEEENGQSRIYLGIHWKFDKTQGIAQGNKVADHVYNSVLKPN